MHATTYQQKLQKTDSIRFTEGATPLYPRCSTLAGDSDSDSDRFMRGNQIKRFAGNIKIHTLSLYSCLMMEQFKMDTSVVAGAVMTLITFQPAEGGMGSPTSFTRSLVFTFFSLFAKKLVFIYKQYLGLMSQEEPF